MTKALECNCGVGFYNRNTQMMCENCLYDGENHYNLMTCAVCNSLDYSHSLNINHHISYFPQQIIKIHRKCHTRPKLKKVGLIQYTHDDYKKFYNIDCYNQHLSTRKKYILSIKTDYKEPRRPRYKQTQEKITYYKMDFLNQ